MFARCCAPCQGRFCEGKNRNIIMPREQIRQRSKNSSQKAVHLEKIHIFVRTLALRRKECKQQLQLFLQPRDQKEQTGKNSSAILVLLFRPCLTSISPTFSQASWGPGGRRSKGFSLNVALIQLEMLGLGFNPGSEARLHLFFPLVSEHSQ